MTMLDQRWVASLEQADETGDLRPLLELLLTQKIPDWILAELAYLFTFRRLNVSNEPSLKTNVVGLAFREYQLSRGSGRTARERIELVAKKFRLSAEHEAALQNMIIGKGRPSVRYRQENKQADAAIEYEKSLRALLEAYSDSKS